MSIGSALVQHHLRTRTFFIAKAPGYQLHLPVSVHSGYATNQTAFGGYSTNHHENASLTLLYNCGSQHVEVIHN